VSYAAIRSQAIDASLKSDTENASKVLGIDYATNSAYPATTAAANGGKGLQASPGNTYAYTVNNAVSPPTYSLTATNPSSQNGYMVTSINNVPTLVTQTAPIVTTPIAADTISVFYTVGDTTVAYISTATGTPTPSVQWQRLAKNLLSGTWTNIAGETSTLINHNYYSDSYYNDGDFGLFRAVFTNAAGSAASPSIRVNFIAGGG
jgi:hypothetical protein